MNPDEKMGSKSKSRSRRSSALNAAENGRSRAEEVAFAAGCILIAGLGWLLRFRQYLAARSLWFDEAMLAKNIVNRTFGEFTQRLYYDQVAPLGFLYSEKIVVSILGPGDLRLRLLPLLAGLLSIIFFVFLARGYLSRWGTILAVFLFSISWPLTYFSNELKQYSLDVLLVILVLLVYGYFLNGTGDKKRAFALGITGVIALWFSQSMIFILASLGITELIRFFQTKKRSDLFRILILGTAWILNFALLYFLSYHIHASNSMIIEQWAAYYMPMPPWKDFGWFKDAFDYLFIGAVGFLAPILVIVAGIALGLFQLFRKRKYSLAWMTIASLTITFLVSSLRIYPIYNRFLLFLVPLLIICIMAGFDLLVEVISSIAPRKLVLGLGLVLMVGLIIPTMKSAYGYFKTPYLKEHIKPVLGYLENNIQPGDVIYVYYGAEPAFSYYQRFYNFSSNQIIWGIRDRENPDKYGVDLSQLENHERVWVVFSHDYYWGGADEIAIFLNYLNSHGQLMGSYLSEGSSIYLFNMIR